MAGWRKDLRRLASVWGGSIESAGKSFIFAMRAYILFLEGSEQMMTARTMFPKGERNA